MKILMTGAGGFVGRALTKRLLADAMPFERLTLADVTAPDVRHPKVRSIGGDLAEPDVCANAIGDGADVVFHLAGALSALAERNYALSRRTNLDATLGLFERAAVGGRRPRIVYASSIAVLGADLPAHVDDDTRPAPTLVYGAHKLMCEIALADFSRRGVLDGVSLRLPGIVARPFGGTVTKSAFISDVFHAFARGDAFVSPVSRTATFWIESVSRCVDNLIHAATIDSGGMTPERALTLPALRLSVPELAEALAHATQRSADCVSYAPDAEIEAVFGRYPPLVTPLAERLGFRNDGDVHALVRAVLADLPS